MDSVDIDPVGKCIAVENYPSLCSSVPDRFIKIIELINSNDVEKVRELYKPHLNGLDAVPFAVTLGDEMIFVGAGPSNSGYVYYVDIEFGNFLLSATVDSFLKALVSCK